MSAFIEVFPVVYRIEVLPAVGLYVLIDVPNVKKGFRLRENSLTCFY